MTDSAFGETGEKVPHKKSALHFSGANALSPLVVDDVIGAFQKPDFPFRLGDECAEVHLG